MSADKTLGTLDKNAFCCAGLTAAEWLFDRKICEGTADAGQSLAYLSFGYGITGINFRPLYLQKTINMRGVAEYARCSRPPGSTQSEYTHLRVIIYIFVTEDIGRIHPLLVFLFFVAHIGIYETQEKQTPEKCTKPL